MAANKILLPFFIFILLYLPLEMAAQSHIPLLEQKISLRADNDSPEAVLKNIEQQGHFNFSYSPQVLQNVKPVTLQVSRSSVREVLDLIFAGQVTYKEKGSHIILIRKQPSAIAEESFSFIISGYVKDGISGNEIPEASVFDKKSRVSALTDQFGYFKMKVDGKQKEDVLFLSVNKIDYRDSVYIIRQKGNTIVNVTIFPLQKSEGVDSAAIRDSLLNVDQMAFLNMILSDELKANTKNISDTLYSKFQVSFLPFLGTNLRLSGNTVNDYSLNILAGYSMGTRKLEVGGLFNINRDSVKYVQIAGLSNIAGGPVSGVQAAGLINVNVKKTSGVQLAGLINNNIDTSIATQLAGLMNVNLKKSSAPQLAGLLNVGVGDVSGVQVAGLLNVAVREINGVQVSGLVNYATHVRGSQIGLLNISDSCSGVPIGLLSIVNKGYHQLEIYSDEVFPLNASFRSGVRPLYNILSAGIQTLKPDENIWYFGYGIGSAIKLGKSWDLNLEATVSQPLKNNNIYYFNPLTKFNLTAEKRFSKYFSVAAGPVFNLFFANTNDPDFHDVLSNIPPAKVIDSSVHNDYLKTSWIGAKLALRFF